MSDEDTDQDDLAAAWGAAIGDEEMAAEGGENGDAMAAEWAAMLDGPGEESEEDQRGAERVLNQDEIDNLLGFNADDLDGDDRKGIRAIINSTMVSYERLPMLEIIFDRLVRLMTTSLRNFTSDNVDVSLETLRSVRFGDYLNSIPLPAILAVFKAEQWENYGLVTVESNLIYSMVDVLLGGRRAPMRMRVEGRPYTTIETNLIHQMVDVVLEDAQQAFAPLSPVDFVTERLETNPRFAAIARPANAAIVVRLRIDMEDRGGSLEILLPYATIEPIRDLLLQMFMGEKFGRDPIWEGHLATEFHATQVDLNAVLAELDLPLRQTLDLHVGQTIPLDVGTDAPILLKCGDVEIADAVAGRHGDRIAVRVASRLRRPKMTLAQFENADMVNGERS